MEGPIRRHWGLVDQIRRSAISVPANIAEGYGLGTRPQFIRGLRIAHGSTRELVELFTLAEDIELLPESIAEARLAEANQTIRLLIGLLRRLGASAPGR